MVDVAGVGMSSLMIKGSLDDSLIQRGFDRIKSGFESTKGAVKGLGADMERLSGVVGGIAKSFMRIASVGVGALTGLAMLSPSLAGSLAKIKIESFKLGNVFGQLIKPVFDAIAYDLLPALGRFVENNKDWIKTLFGGGAEAIGDLSKIISGEWSKIENIFPKAATALTLGAGGLALGGPIGGFMGFAIGWAIASAVTTDSKNLDSVMEGEVSKLENMIPTGMGVTMAAAGWKVGGFKGAVLGFILGSAIGTAIVEPPDKYKDMTFGKTMYQADRRNEAMGEYGVLDYLFNPVANVKNVGSAFQTGTAALVDAFSWLFSKFNRRDMELSVAQGGSR